MQTRMRQWLFIVFLIVLLVGCTRSGRENSLTPVGSLTPAPFATATPAPEATTQETKLDCADDAEFIQDLTIPDGSQISVGETVDKRWSVENSGSCDWGLGYRLIPDPSNPLVAGREGALYPAKAGTNAVWRVMFQAPDEPGEYLGSWQAFNPQGQPFGDPVFILIDVVNTESAEEPE